MDAALENAAIAGFAFCLLWAAASDARGFVIPDRALIGIVVLFPIHLLARMLAAGSVDATLIQGLFSCALAAIVFIAGFGLFAMQYIGGGDAKFATAVALWAGRDNIFLFLIVAALAGGIMAAAVLIWRSVFATAAGETGEGGFGMRLHRGFKDRVPFGIAIAAGGLLVAAKLASV